MAFIHTETGSSRFIQMRESSDDAHSTPKFFRTPIESKSNTQTLVIWPKKLHEEPRSWNKRKWLGLHLSKGLMSDEGNVNM